MAQHPGDGRDRRDRQSVFAHLAGLYARLELDLPAARTTEVLRRVVASRDDFPTLRRDGGPGELTVLHMVNAGDQDDDAHRAEQWGRAVLQAWASHRAVIDSAVKMVTST